MANVCLTVSYDGTAYHGFQDQGSELSTIQGCLEQAIAKLTGAQLRITGAGRTDAGVHAHGQVVNFYTEAAIPIDRWPLALNSCLPRDIVVRHAVVVPAAFHARFSATCKIYRYTIDNGLHRDVFQRRYAYHIREPLDIQAMSAAANHFVGRHDFSAFRSTGSTPTAPTRTVQWAKVEQHEHLVHFTVCADGFLYHMVRIMAGTLIDVGKQRRSIQDVANALHTGQREHAGATAPAHGLCLMYVQYPDFA